MPPEEALPPLPAPLALPLPLAPAPAQAALLPLPPELVTAAPQLRALYAGVPPFCLLLYSIDQRYILCPWLGVALCHLIISYDCPLCSGPPSFSVGGAMQCT